MDTLSSAAKGVSSKVSAAPLAKAAAIYNLRLEPVDSMKMFLSRCGASDRPSMARFSLDSSNAG